ncbi:transcriptional regulator form adherence 6 [Podospora conica]|nr:transcriptional regulator form adherence 6 [Schizothecium conicum]
MPRLTHLPTPGNSTDIKGTDGSRLAPLQMAFELPPPAVASHDSGAPYSPTNSPSSSRRASKSAVATAPYPLQASERVKARRRSSAGAQPPKEQFVLPPPPTRSRKIIQMKPKEEVAPAPAASTGTKAVLAAAGSKSAGPATTPTAGAKKKPPSATSAAGRKIARKTAHSLIERRRRSKMNEEFAVLKDMIPACSGEMHKLAILQASIEYVRYLEDCVTKLKEENARSTVSDPPPPFRASAADAHSSDVDMTDSSQGPSPVLTPNPITFQQPIVSPALLPGSYRDHRGSLSSAPGGSSATTSPALDPQGYGYAHSLASIAGSALTSPALPPQRDLDQEATAALLMLNQMDRRLSAVRGMSVKDLLSS